MLDRVLTCSDYIQSLAKTYDVNRKGRPTQNHSGIKNNNATVPANEAQKYIQYFLRSLFEVDMVLILMFILRAKL